MKLIIVGGVAGGASAAARMRRLDERAEIVLVERGDDVSYANGGMPYHLGGVSAEREKLLVMPPVRPLLPGVDDSDVHNLSGGMASWRASRVTG